MRNDFLGVSLRVFIDWTQVPCAKSSVIPLKFAGQNFRLVETFK